MSRREFFAKLAVATSTGALMSLAGPVIEKAYGAGPCSGHLTDIEHFVLLMQENRSFDHYFGTLSGGVRGPIGLGFRVPTFVISPCSRGPLKCSTVLDHTSQLKLLRTRFGVPVPNLSQWQDQAVADMTTASNFAVPPNPSKPNFGPPAAGGDPETAAVRP